MKLLSIDIETFSSIDLTKCGVYAYTQSDDFEILLFAYAFDNEEVRIIDIASGEKIPEKIIKALLDVNITKTAFNAQFERVCLSKYLNQRLPPNSWQCTSVQAAILGLPLSLEGVAQVLKLTEQKMKEGKDLIRYFSMPCKATKANGQRTRNHPNDSIEKWNIFKNYCKQDVEVERSIRNRLIKYKIIDSEQRIYNLDQDINDRGILVDLDLVKKAIECNNIYKNNTLLEAQNITGLDNPNSVSQLKQWLLENDIVVDSLSKKVVNDIIKECNGDVEKVLNLRLQLSKTSIKKYEAIDRGICSDGKVRGLLQFYGANRTGRWAGRLVQVQNLPQNHIKDLSVARNLLKSGEFDMLELLFESVPQVLSELIRTAFVPKENHKFIIADFSAIEARVIAWLAGEKWRMDVFATHGKIYEASASQMFKVPIEEITKTSPLRQKGKISELALGYGGSVGALTAMGAIDMGIEEKELQSLVDAWRYSNPNITKLWWDIDKAAIKAVKDKTSVEIGKIKINYESDTMFVTLPSKRKLSYIRPRIQPNRFGRDAITYEGIGTTKKWERIETYGPKLVENIVQAIARDLLAESMLKLSNKGYEIVMHIHDEVVIEVEKYKDVLNEICDIMAISPSWGKGLLLRADGFECEYYRKD